ncbi:Protein of unknown function DUF247, plant [Dillenia turbinata]|uniref:Uncharacterized protein n=1 Tax=Dillenia turbinata TaxID=194707 RepID=A0AAN8WDN2_9MAGN
MENGKQGNHHLVVEIEEAEESEGVAALRNRLKQRRELERMESRRPACIHRVPPSLAGISEDAIYPEVVSIGPYHRGEERLLDFESYKLSFLDSLLQRVERKGNALEHFFRAMQDAEEKARNCYSESIPMSSNDFAEMLLLDGCFIVELFRHVCCCDSVGKTRFQGSLTFSIISMPWLIPILCRDLLKLENQLPFFILEIIFDLSNPVAGGAGAEGRDPLGLLALKFFNLVLPRPSEILKQKMYFSSFEHLLHLFHSSYRHQIKLNYPRQSWWQKLGRTCVCCLENCIAIAKCNSGHTHSLPVSKQSIQSATQLHLSRIKLRPRGQDAPNLLFINFRRIQGVLEIPALAINDATTTVFINCVALEQCHAHWRPYNFFFSAYIAFMSCLVISVKDVMLLCNAGIITSYSQDDYRVARLFKKLGENVMFKVLQQQLASHFWFLGFYPPCLDWDTNHYSHFELPSSKFLMNVVTGVGRLQEMNGYLELKERKNLTTLLMSGPRSQESAKQNDEGSAGRIQQTNSISSDERGIDKEVFH